jgi:hypothetical protein
MYKIRSLSAVAVALLLAACGSRSPSSPAASAPPLIYLHEDTLFQQVPARAPERLVALPDGGKVLAATVLGDTAFVLREQGLQRVSLADGASDLVSLFDIPARAGQMMPMAEGSRVLYSVMVSDADARFGVWGTRIGLYQAGREQATLYFAHDAQALGLTADGRGLYILPRGEDSSFGRLLVASLETGETEGEQAVQGLVPAALSPDSRYLAMTSVRYTRPDKPEDVLAVYDMASRPLTPREITFPHVPSHTRWLLWSPDSRCLYFVLWSGNRWDDPTASYGLWRLDVESAELSQVAAVSEPLMWPRLISPDGQWLLLTHERKDVAIMVHLPTGATESFTLPVTAVAVGWR